MSDPLVSIIIPTYNRPHLLPRAVHSALAQNIDNFEVIVVDDASLEPVKFPEHPRLKIIRLSVNRGISATRNAGAESARGRWLTYLDDDDELLPHMAQMCLNAIAANTFPEPIAILSGMEVVNQNGKVVETRLPPTLPKGSHFFLEEIKPGQSFLSKQTLFIEREVLLGIGGYDESFSSREHTEMFLRLNQVCTIVGLPIIGYRQYRHEGPRLSCDRTVRQIDFHRLIHKHQSIFQTHPKQFADFVYEHALTSYRLGQKGASLSNLLWAIRIHPRHVLGKIRWSLKNQLS